MLVVRKGNPRGIKDWDDLVKPGTVVVTPNPKTSGGRALELPRRLGLRPAEVRQHRQGQGVREAALQERARARLGARGATTTFAQRGIGHALIAWENEAYLLVNEMGKDKYEVVYPSITIAAETPVALVDKNVDKHGTRAAAEAYLTFLYTAHAQELAAKRFYRPSDAAVAKKFEKVFPKVKTFTVDQTFGGWQNAHKAHFADGALFDQIYQPGS